MMDDRLRFTGARDRMRKIERTGHAPSKRYAIMITNEKR